MNICRTEVQQSSAKLCMEAMSTLQKLPFFIYWLLYIHLMGLKTHDLSLHLALTRKEMPYERAHWQPFRTAITVLLERHITMKDTEPSSLTTCNRNITKIKDGDV